MPQSLEAKTFADDVRDIRKTAGTQLLAIGLQLRIPQDSFCCGVQSGPGLIEALGMY